MKRIRVAASVFLLVLLVSARPMPTTPKPQVLDPICQWCWWCLECWLSPAAPTSIEYEMQQTLNPF